MNRFTPVLSVVCGLALSACSSQESAPVVAVEPQAVTKTDVSRMIDISYTIKTGGVLTPGQTQLIEQYEQTKKMDFDLLTKELVKRHRDSKSTPRVEKEMMDLVRVTSPQVIDKEMKETYWANLASHLGNQKLKYYVEGTSVFDIFDTYYQCYSATTLFQLYARQDKVSLNEYQSENWVIIMEPGHVLPGYFKKVDGKWHLFGIETTRPGRALKKYGPASDLDLPIRIFTAHAWVLFEVFKNVLADSHGLMQEMQKAPETLYGFNLDRLEARISEMFPNTAPSASKALNASIMAFGSSNPPSDPMVMEPMGEQEVTLGDYSAEEWHEPMIEETSENQKEEVGPSVELVLKNLPEGQTWHYTGSEIDFEKGLFTFLSDGKLSSDNQPLGTYILENQYEHENRILQLILEFSEYNYEMITRELIFEESLEGDLSRQKIKVYRGSSEFDLRSSVSAEVPWGFMYTEGKFCRLFPDHKKFRKRGDQCRVPFKIIKEERRSIIDMGMGVIGPVRFISERI